jgi:hypothetical protein
MTFFEQTLARYATPPIYLDRTLKILRHEGSCYASDAAIYDLIRTKALPMNKRGPGDPLGSFLHHELKPHASPTAAANRYAPLQMMRPYSHMQIFSDFGRFQDHFRLEPRSCLLRA